METLLAIVIGGLFAAAFYSLLRRSIVKLAVGLILLSQGSNLLIFVSAGLVRRGQPPILGTTGQGPMADPLPQALILTAIVISFGVLAFSLVLVGRAHQAAGTEDLDRMRGAGQ